jgi:soluble lytic murein transglycosylase
MGGWGLFQKAISELSLPLSYQNIIRSQAAANHLDPALIAAVIYAETRYDPRTSPTGAEGLMQIEPQTAEFLAHRSGGYAFRVSDLSEPSVNIAYGSYYLRYLMNEYDNSLVATLAAYNGGETNVDRWLSQAGVSPRAFSADQIPFPETRAYVDKVLQAQKDYRTTYAVQLGYG